MGSDVRVLSHRWSDFHGTGLPGRDFSLRPPSAAPPPLYSASMSASQTTTGERSEGGDLVARLVDWCSRHPLRLAVLFGSRARGDARPTSDVDLAVWTAALPAPQERLRWSQELASQTGAPVQIVLATPRLDPVLGFQIAREGHLLFEAEAGSWARERLRLWHLYQDSLPFLRAARKQLRDSATEVRDGA